MPVPRFTADVDNIHTIRPVYDGAGFLTDLASQRTQAVDRAANLVPGTDPAADPATNSAYCLYRMRCFAEADSAELELSWKGDVPAPTNCWIGLSDWGTNTWEWRNLPEGNLLEVDPQRFACSNHFGYVAVLLLGEKPASLKRIELSCTPDATEPFTLFCPMADYTTYLINREGQVVKQWVGEHLLASSQYLLDDLTLLRTTALMTGPVSGAGAGGGLELWDFEGNELWSADLGAMGISPHHDIEPMPNGNVLVLCWDLIEQQTAIDMGRHPDSVTEMGLEIDCVYEIVPVGSDGAEVVWSWHFRDHLVQDIDPELTGYGVIEDSPGRLDINYTSERNPDFTHGNSIDYNADLDQIAIGLRNTSEFYIIDHSTTTAEAAGTTGGRFGRGGEFLYRWGNPNIWDKGVDGGRMLYFQHDVEWIPEGYPGAGHLLLFNNGDEEGAEAYSRILELELPLDVDGSYVLEEGGYGPSEPYWEFVHEQPYTMFSLYVSGSQRLPDGNTMICVGMSGWLLEVDPEGTVVWEYQNRLPDYMRRGLFRAETYQLFTPWLTFDTAE